jgi:hypothetical protein
MIFFFISATYQYNLADYLFVPSVFGENVPAAEFGWRKLFAGT